MSNETILFFTFIIPIVILISFLFYTRRKKIEDEKNYPILLQKLKDALVAKNTKSIIHYGELVVWNEQLKHKDLVYLYKTIEELSKQNQQLKKLTLIYFNRKLDMERHRPPSI